MRPRLAWACDTGVPAYMDQGAGAAAERGLADLHALATRLDALDTLRGAWFAHLAASVAAVVQAEPGGMVDALLALRARALRVVAECFADPDGGRSRFAHALDDAFTRGFAAGKTKPAEMIAKYIDVKMQSGQSGMGDVDFDDLLDRVLALFRYTSGACSVGGWQGVRLTAP